MSAHETSCAVSYLTLLTRGLQLRLESIVTPVYFPLSMVEFSVIKSIMGDDGVPLVVVGLKAIRRFVSHA